LSIIPYCHSSQKRSSNLRGDWKVADTKRKQRELGDYEVIGKLQIQKESRGSLEIAR